MWWGVFAQHDDRLVLQGYPRSSADLARTRPSTTGLLAVAGLVAARPRRGWQLECRLGSCASGPSTRAAPARATAPDTVSSSKLTPPKTGSRSLARRTGDDGRLRAAARVPARAPAVTRGNHVTTSWLRPTNPDGAPGNGSSTRGEPRLSTPPSPGGSSDRHPLAARAAAPIWVWSGTELRRQRLRGAPPAATTRAAGRAPTSNGQWPPQQGQPIPQQSGQWSVPQGPRGLQQSGQWSGTQGPWGPQQPGQPQGQPKNGLAMPALILGIVTVGLSPLPPQ